MSRLFYHVMQDSAGNLLFDVAGTMRIAGEATLATIYGDEALTVILPNPMTNHVSYASFKCFLGAGDYDFYMAKAGYSFETLTGVQGHGTMAQQDASAVAITGGTATLGVANIGVSLYVGTGTPPGNTKQHIFYPKQTSHGLTLSPDDNNTGTGAAISFQNTAGSMVGAIVTTASATAYNTSSDGRLKEAVEDLPDALATLLRLDPVRFRWKVDGSVGHGLIAQEVQAVLPGVVSPLGEADGFLGIDYARLVPHLIGACKTMAAQVAALQARLALLEDALGV